MMGFIEKTAFLRSLNYLRVSHQYAPRYNWGYPILLGGIVAAGVLNLTAASSAFEQGGLVVQFTPVLSILAPFYIAALAAVSTFSGSKAIDKPFDMSEPVLLKVIGDGGDWENIDVTPRHFLSLLFGYCTTLSIFLLTISVFAGLISKAAKALILDHHEVVLGGILVCFLVLLSQLILCTLLGVYYLADKIHRG